jgi:hypothetical protein
MGDEKIRVFVAQPPVKKELESYTHTYLFTYLNFDESHAPVSSHVFMS